MPIYFVPTKLPCDMSREEWKACDRWRRVTQKELRKYEESIIKSTVDLLIFGDSRTDYAAEGWRDPKAEKAQLLGPASDRIDRIVNPPVLLGPYMGT